MGYRTSIINPDALSDSEREIFTDALYQAHCRTFRGVSREAFSSYVVSPPAHRTRIFVVHGKSGAFRGYTAFHVYLAEIDSQPVAIVRMEAGVDPDFREKSLSIPFVLRELLSVCLGYRDRQILFVASFVHPSAYVIFERHAPDMWPRPGVQTPPEVAEMMPQIARLFDMTPSSSPGTYRIGWITKTCRPPRTIRSAARFFMERNPGYKSGDGLLTVIPVSLGRLIQGAVSFARFRLSRALAPPRAEPIRLDQEKKRA